MYASQVSHLIERITAFLSLLFDRVFSRRRVAIGDEVFWLTSYQAHRIELLKKLPVSIEIPDAPSKPKSMILSTEISEVGVVKLTFFLGDQSAVDSVIELHEDEYGVLSSDLEGKLVVDFGANVGDFAIACAKKGATVRAYEPNMDLFPLLEENVRLNFVESQVETFPFGIWSHSLKASAAYDPLGSGAGRMTVTGENLTLRRSMEFDLVQASQVLNDIDQKIDFLKVDIEGAEYDVITELARAKCLLQVKGGAIEYHRGIRTLKQTLESCGFDVQTIEKNGGYGILRFSKS